MKAQDKVIGDPNYNLASTEHAYSEGGRISLDQIHRDLQPNQDT